MPRVMYDLDPREPTEEDYYQFALMELGGDTLNWYRLIKPHEGYKYSNITTHDNLPSNFSKPTESEVNAKISELKTAYKAAEYKRQRRKEYPKWSEQLDMIYNEGIDAWKASIKKIKDKYPKG